MDLKDIKILEQPVTNRSEGGLLAALMRQLFQKIGTAMLPNIYMQYKRKLENNDKDSGIAKTAKLKALTNLKVEVKGESISWNSFLYIVFHLIGPAIGLRGVTFSIVLHTSSRDIVASIDINGGKNDSGKDGSGDTKESSK